MPCMYALPRPRARLQIAAERKRLCHANPAAKPDSPAANHPAPASARARWQQQRPGAAAFAHLHESKPCPPKSSRGELAAGTAQRLGGEARGSGPRSACLLVSPPEAALRCGRLPADPASPCARPPGLPGRQPSVAPLRRSELVPPPTRQRGRPRRRSRGVPVARARPPGAGCTCRRSGRAPTCAPSPLPAPPIRALHKHTPSYMPAQLRG